MSNGHTSLHVEGQNAKRKHKFQLTYLVQVFVEAMLAIPREELKCRLQESLLSVGSALDSLGLGL